MKEQAKTGPIGASLHRRRVLRCCRPFTSSFWPPPCSPTPPISGSTPMTVDLSVLFYYSNYYSASASGPLTPKLTSDFQHLVPFVRGAVLCSLAVDNDCLLTIRMRLRTVVIVLLSSSPGRRPSVYPSSKTPTVGGRSYTAPTPGPIRSCGEPFSPTSGSVARSPKRGTDRRLVAWPSSSPAFPIHGGSPFVYWGGFVAIDFSCAVILLAILDGRVERPLVRDQPWWRWGSSPMRSTSGTCRYSSPSGTTTRIGTMWCGWWWPCRSRLALTLALVVPHGTATDELEPSIGERQVPQAPDHYFRRLCRSARNRQRPRYPRYPMDRQSHRDSRPAMYRKGNDALGVVEDPSP